MREDITQMRCRFRRLANYPFVAHYHQVTPELRLHYDPYAVTSAARQLPTA